MSPEALSSEALTITSPSFTEVHTKIMGLKQFVLQTDRATFPDHIRPAEYPDKFILEENMDEGPEALGEDLELINSSGNLLVQALEDPELMHDALDGLLALEMVRRHSEELGNATPVPAYELDKNGAPYLDAIFASGDKLASMKALSIIYGRHDAGISAQANIERYWPRVIELSDPETRTAESKSFYLNLLEAMSSSNTSLFGSFARSIGYESPFQLKDVWLATDSKGFASAVNMETDRSWANIRSMIILERMESGLCKKITEAFNIVNFARYKPEMLSEMYRSRVEEPEKPYVLSITAKTDHNGALASYKEIDSRTKIQKRLARKGIRFEEHECGDREDVERVIQGAVELRSEHGSGIKDLVIHAHGSPDQIILSEAQYGILGKRVERNMRTGEIDYLGDISPAMRRGAKIILRSCSAGKEAGGSFSIARDISLATGKEVIAPGLDVASTVSVHNRLGRPRIEPRFATRKHLILAAPLFFIPAVGARTAVRVAHSRAKRTYNQGWENN
jgi:hypothetical protein